MQRSKRLVKGSLMSMSHLRLIFAKLGFKIKIKDINRTGCLEVTRRMGFLLGTVILFLHSCGLENSSKTVINLSFIPWMGNYPFYFAIEKKIPEKYGAELRLLETYSAEDFRRVNIKEHVDAFSSSLMELTMTNEILDEDLEIVTVLDYSNGVDVIIARNGISSLQDLDGKVVGFDWRSLGHYFFKIALRAENIEEETYIHRSVDQNSAFEFFNDGMLDVYVSYPPVSNSLLKDESLNVIFDSSMVPYQIIDVLAMKKGNQSKYQILRQIWYDTTYYIKNNRAEYISFVAQLMDIDVSQVSEELDEIVIIDADMQSDIDRQELLNLMRLSCEILGQESESCINSLQKIHFKNMPFTVLNDDL